MMFQSMHELDRRSHRISEEPSPSDGIQKLINLYQQLLLDMDHQRVCLLKLQRSQQKTALKIQMIGDQLAELQKHNLQQNKDDTVIQTSSASEIKPKRWYHRMFCIQNQK